MWVRDCLNAALRAVTSLHTSMTPSVTILGPFGTPPRSVTVAPAARLPHIPVQSPVESTRDLLDLARGGDDAALGRLYQRYMPALTRWAHGRLPLWAREMRDTEDLVQESVMQTLKEIGRFEPTRDGAFHAFLRKILHNRLIDEIRRVSRIKRELLDDDLPIDTPSPVEQVIGHEALERYESALSQLRPDEREAVVARVELGCSYAEIAESLGKSSPDAARMMVARALVRLAEEMRRAT
jgi:RNA polymerase sigma factor (sigma-70 family)